MDLPAAIRIYHNDTMGHLPVSLLHSSCRISPDSMFRKSKSSLLVLPVLACHIPYRISLCFLFFHKSRSSLLLPAAEAVPVAVVPAEAEAVPVRLPAAELPSQITNSHPFHLPASPYSYRQMPSSDLSPYSKRLLSSPLPVLRQVLLLPYLDCGVQRFSAFL